MLHRVKLALLTFRGLYFPRRIGGLELLGRVFERSGVVKLTVGQTLQGCVFLSFAGSFARKLAGLLLAAARSG